MKCATDKNRIKTGKEIYMQRFLCLINCALLLMTCSKSPTSPESTEEGPVHSFTLTLAPHLSHAGTTFSLPDRDIYRSGDTAILYAYAWTGYSFVGWSGDATGTADSLVIVMTKDMTVFADFADSSTGRTMVSIALAGNDGSIVLSPDGGVYDSGTVVSATVRHDTGLIFSGWGGLLTGKDTVASFTATRNGTLRANFTLDPNVTFATVHINPFPAHGKITIDPPGIKWDDGYKFKPGTDITLSAVPDGKYEFDVWGGDLAPLQAHMASFPATITADIIVSAAFILPPPASSWTRRTSGNGNGLLSVAWNNKLIVVVGNMGTILTSPDGVTWTSRTSGVTTCLNCVIWTGSLFVCVGDGGTILTSRDAIAWELKKSPTTYGLQSVVWTGSKYVAVGGEYVHSGLNYNNVVTSRDATTWTSARSGFGIWYAVAWTGSRFVATGYDYSFTTLSDNSSSELNVSTDGESWTFENSDLNGRRSINALVWARNMLVGVGGSRRTDDPFSSVFTSPDGTFWTEAEAPTKSSLNGVAWTGSNYVAVGADGVICTSAGGSTWKLQKTGTTDDFFGVAWAGTKCVAVGFGGMIMTSP
jgi:uncharacterized repeat protein (TIGR02543 family)